MSMWYILGVVLGFWFGAATTLFAVEWLARVVGDCARSRGR